MMHLSHYNALFQDNAEKQDTGIAIANKTDVNIPIQTCNTPNLCFSLFDFHLANNF